MASTYTPNLNLELQATGDNTGVWGDHLNTNVFTIVDNAMGATVSVALTNANVTLTTSQTQNAFITLTGTLTANVQVIFPAIGRTYLVRNQTTGNFTVTLAITGGVGATALAERGPGGFFFLDGTNVRPLGGLARYRSSAGTTAITAADSGGTVEITATGAANFDAVATLGSTFRTMIWAPAGATVTLTPNGSETINGAASLILPAGQVADVRCNGVGLVAKITGNPQSGPQLQGYYFGLGLATSATNAANAVDISVGSAAADTSPYTLMQLLAALGKRVDQAWTVGGTPATPLGGLDTGSVANNTYYVWLIQRSDTGVVDALFSLSASAPTMPTNYDRKRLIGSLIRASATNGSPVSALVTGPGGWTEVTAVSTGSGTTATIAFPATATEFELYFKSVSSAGTTNLLMRLNVGGTPVATGYEAGGPVLGQAAATVDSTGFVIFSNSAAIIMHGCVRFKKWPGVNEWIQEGQTTLNPTGTGTGSGTAGKSPVLAGAANGVTLLYSGGSAFDAGSVFLRYR